MVLEKDLSPSRLPEECCTTSLSSDGSSLVSSCSSSSIDDIKESPLGSTSKKRKVAVHCRWIITDLDGVCEKYHESLACVLGNSFLYENEDEKKAVSQTVSDILNLVMDSKGSNKGISDLLLPETHQQFLESMQVPDWVLLYFKIQAKLPDAAWQTLLNLKQLGRSRVLRIFVFLILWVCVAVDPHLSKVLFSLGSDCSIVCCSFVIRSTHHVKWCRSPGCWWECVYVEGGGEGGYLGVSVIGSSDLVYLI